MDDPSGCNGSILGEIVIGARPPTAVERSIYLKFRADVQRYAKKSQILGFKIANYEIMRGAVARHGMVLPSVDGRKALELAREYRRVMAWMAMLEQRKIGFQVRGREIDLTMPPGTNSDQIVAIQNPPGLGAIPLIVWGVVVVVGLVAWVAKLYSDSQTLENQVDILKREGEARICSDPNSPACQSWQAVQQSAAYKGNNSMIAKLSAGLDTIGGVFKSAIGWLAVGAVALAVFKYLAEKKR